MKATHGAIFLKYVMWYFYNVPPEAIATQVYETTDRNYIASKIKMIMEEPLKWYSDLDSLHRIRFCELVLKKYDTKGEFNV